jgi:hypothetical protein
MPSGPRLIPAWPVSVRFKPCDQRRPAEVVVRSSHHGDEKSPRPLSRQDNWHGKSRSQALGLLAPHLAPEPPAEALAAAKTRSFAAHLPREQIADCRQGA